MPLFLRGPSEDALNFRLTCEWHALSLPGAAGARLRLLDALGDAALLENTGDAGGPSGSGTPAHFKTALVAAATAGHAAPPTHLSNPHSSCSAACGGRARHGRLRTHKLPGTRRGAPACLARRAVCALPRSPCTKRVVLRYVPSPNLRACALMYADWGYRRRLSPLC